MKKMLAVIAVWLGATFCHYVHGASPSNLDWVVSNITSKWRNATVSTSTVDRMDLPAGMPHSGWSDVPATVHGGGEIVSVPPYLFVESSAPLDMVVIPSGKFLMGGGNMFGYFSNAPPHIVDVMGFNMDIDEVTWELWMKVRKWGEARGYTDLPAGQAGSSKRELTTPQHPVVNVNWYDCVKWCNARSEKEGLTPVYYLNRTQTNIYRIGKSDLEMASVDWSANGYRLPTEAEWEKASRGGLEKCYFPWGNAPLSGARANYFSSGDPFDEGTTPVGYYNGKQEINGGKKGHDMMNRYGLYDMAGNVYEWCWDWYGEISETMAGNPRGPSSGAERIIRGGCWRSRVEYLLFCVKRTSLLPAEQNDFVGFRCVRNL
ncbi:MAG: hypothetical protein A2283_20070 [Lentisphaerae bacterium RIFOXYA12_FULL_48_11]|nr:MAG: hypothetical protein A2283_20070 [Lentisphaerae bacterium RIFOXYA12_FULL_48_11]